MLPRFNDKVVRLKINIMRQITREAINAFYNAEKFSKANMLVEVQPNVTILRLHGNAVAYRYNDPNKEVWITNAGWRSNTTKERLNGLNGVQIHQSKGVWYLNGKEWDGKLTLIMRTVNGILCYV